MFKRLFGGGDGAGSSKPPAPSVSVKSTTSTVDAIQKLGEASGGRRAGTDRLGGLLAAAAPPPAPPLRAGRSRCRRPLLPLAADRGAAGQAP